MKTDHYVQITIEIMMTTRSPLDMLAKHRVQEEISIFCSRLERLELQPIGEHPTSNHIYLHNQDVKEV